MKNSLVQHIKLVFDALNINTEFSVYDSTNDILPDWLHGIKISNEFVVCCSSTFEKDRLQGFIHKDILQIGNNYYWFEGNDIKIKERINENIVEPPCLKSAEKLKTTTRLSSWLDNYIYGDLNSEYAPDYQRFEYNLDLSHEDNQKYLGTYFPRSYAETFCIFDNLFNNEIIKSKYSKLAELNILSVGCGTGGDIIGLLTAINKHFSSIKKMNVFAIDGNEDALNITSNIVSHFNDQLHKEVILATKHVVFDAITSIGINKSFNFIITSKMINEIINKGKGRRDNSYYDFAKIYTPMLEDNGIMMILDVTTQVGKSEYCPILMNRQINKFVWEHSDIASIIPVPCSIKENCQAQCFSQKEFSVTHSRFSSDKSRVAYRILTKKTFAQGLRCGKPDTQYQIQSDKCCGQGDTIADGFFLPSTMHSLESLMKQPTPALMVEKHQNDDKKTHKTVKEEHPVIQPNQLGEAYLIDTNAFIYAPNIINKISNEYPIFVSAKVVDELDHRKDITSGNDKKKVQKALKSINMAISGGRVQTITSDARLLPVDFDRRSPDNLILSVALKLKRMGYSPILVTSDNGFQVKAKTLKITTIPYTKVKSKI